MCGILGGRCRTGGVGSAQHGPVLEEFFHTCQSDSSRTSFARPGLLRGALRGSRLNQVDSRVPSLEGSVYLPFILVDLFGPHGHQQNRDIPSTFGIFSVTYPRHQRNAWGTSQSRALSGYSAHPQSPVIHHPCESHPRYPPSFSLPRPTPRRVEHRHHLSQRSNPRRHAV